MSGELVPHAERGRVEFQTLGELQAKINERGTRPRCERCKGVDELRLTLNLSRPGAGKGVAVVPRMVINVCQGCGSTFYGVIAKAVGRI